jgi:hypothetical protein
MRIRYQPKRGAVEVELRDIVGGSPLAKWYTGDERDIPPGTKVVWSDGASPAFQLDAAVAIFRHGPDFVDASTGKNPLYSCANCGAEALAEHAFDYERDQTIPFVNADGKRLCPSCWLGAHPDRIPYFRDTLRYGKDAPDVIKRAQAIAAKAAPVQAAPPPDKPADTAAPGGSAK